MKLLIVDDQSTVVQGLLHCTNWAAMGFTVVDTALNAVDAKASLLRQEAEVMLCDIEMPMESGLDLLDWLRQRGMTTRCIFLTATLSSDMHRRHCGWAVLTISCSPPLTSRWRMQ